MIPSLPPADELLDLLPDGMCVVDGEGRFLYVNSSFERILGYNRDEMLELCVFDLVHADDHAATTEEAARVTAGAFQHHFRNRYLHKAGHYVDIQWSARRHAEFGVRIGLAREVTELRRAERELEHRATHDALTGLANRDYLHIELGSALEHARVGGDRLALLFMDLDGFKVVNDVAGHHIGDCVLREVAGRVKQGLRQTDLVARFGGDEFVVLLRGCHDASTAGRVADDLRTRLSGVPLTGMGAYQLDASIGIACFPEHGSTVEALLAYADRAMYAIKRQRASSEPAVAATWQASSTRGRS